jgi:hypothetical protein
MEYLYQFKDFQRKSYTGIVVWAQGNVTYFKNGKYHRLDGPARIFHHSKTHPNQYWIEGEQIKNCYSDEAFFFYLDLVKLVNIKNI